MLVNKEEGRGSSSDGSEASGTMNDNERRWEIIKLVNDEECSGSSSCAVKPAGKCMIKSDYGK